MGWWVGKVRQFATHVHAEVRPEERRELNAWLTPAQRRLFDSMHPADRRHGLDVVWRLRAEGWSEPTVLLAGLFHDAGKGRTGLWPRVVWSLGEHYGRLPRQIVGFVPGSVRRWSASTATLRRRRSWRSWPAARCRRPS